MKEYKWKGMKEVLWGQWGILKKRFLLVLLLFTYQRQLHYKMAKRYDVFIKESG